jgi:hypothetical protein
MKKLFFLVVFIYASNAFSQVKPIQKNEPQKPVRYEGVNQDEKIEEIVEDAVVSTASNGNENKNGIFSEKKNWKQLSIRPSLFVSLNEDKNRIDNLKQRKDKIKSELEASKKNDPGFQPKGPFETTEDYQVRMKKANDDLFQKQNLLIRQIDDEIASINNRYYIVNNKSFTTLFKLDQYNADRGVWNIIMKENGLEYPIEIKIKPQEAQVLWNNMNSIIYSVLTQQNYKPEDYIYSITYSNQYAPIYLQSTNSMLNSAATGDDDNKIFTKVEVEADFPGGVNAWRRFLANNLDSEVPGANGAPPGQYTVIVRFVVAKDGSVSNVQAESEFGFGMEQESVRVVKKSGKWKPGIQNGKEVISYKRQPITWVVSE